MKRVRITDVAAAAGVSTSTVSLVLNDRPSRITPETAEAVRRVAADLGYRPDLNARTLRTQRTNLLGFISDMVVTTPFAGDMIRGAQDAAWERGHLLLIVNTESDSGHERELVTALRDRRLDGYLFASMYHRSRENLSFLGGTPVVGMDVEIGDQGPSFVPDEAQGAAAATQVLVEAGHRRIAHLRGQPYAQASALRAEAFDRVMKEAGLETAGLVREYADDSPLSESRFAELATRELLQLADPPTALFAYNDRMAIGVYRAASSLGLSIPRDLSVMGFDNQQTVAEELPPPLSTVALPHYEMGYRATQRLIDILGGLVEPDPVLELIPCPLVLRESVAPSDPASA